VPFGLKGLKLLSRRDLKQITTWEMHSHVVKWIHDMFGYDAFRQHAFLETFRNAHANRIGCGCACDSAECLA